MPKDQAKVRTRRLVIVGAKVEPEIKAALAAAAIARKQTLSEYVREVLMGTLGLGPSREKAS